MKEKLPSSQIYGCNPRLSAPIWKRKWSLEKSLASSYGQEKAASSSFRNIWQSWGCFTCWAEGIWTPGSETKSSGMALLYGMRMRLMVWESSSPPRPGYSLEWDCSWWQCNPLSKAKVSPSWDAGKDPADVRVEQIQSSFPQPGTQLPHR